MTRTAEATLLAGAAALAAFGVALVNLAFGEGVDAQVALTFLVFALAFGGVHLAIRAWAQAASPYLWPLAAVLSAIGFVAVYRIDRQLATLQRWWMLVAAALAIVTLFALRRVGLALARRFRYLLLAATVGLLGMPLLPSGGWPIQGLEVNGSRLWVRFDVFGLQVQFQPAEFAKVTLVLFLASYLADRQQALTVNARKVGPVFLPEPRQLLPVVIAWAISLGVLIWQRDLGASLLLLALFVAMLYAATGASAYLWFGGGLFALGSVASWVLFDHVQRRVSAWLTPFTDYEDTGYQIAQSLFALGSGSISGSGLGLGRPDLIPHAATDFVFAAIGEELGLAGTVAVIATYALLVGVAFGIGLRSRDTFRKLLATGLALIIGIQAFVIIGGVIRTLPLTGVPLPFMSYGGTSLVVSFIMLTLLSRVSHEEQA